MKNIFAKAAATMLFGALIFSVPAAGQELGPDTKLKLKSARSTPKNGKNLKLKCDGVNTLGGLLAKLNPNKAYTITVSGECNENVEIVGFQHLTLQAEEGASISDASDGTATVVSVAYTTFFEMLGFTINGGDIGVVCGSNSTCLFADNTVQDAVSAGAWVFQSRADFVGGVMQNNERQGLLVQEGSTVSVINVSLLNNSTGGAVGYGSTLIANDSTIQDNELDGLRVASNSTLRLAGNTVNGNGRDGVHVFLNSFAFFEGGNTVSNNEQGVRISDLSMSVFSDEDITGNVGTTQVLCEPQFPATRGALTNINGGSTNCVEP